MNNTVHIGQNDILLTDQGAGHPVLLLHGGAGPASVSGFAERLASDETRVLVPTHPGFGGTPRHESLTTIRAIADVYIGLLDDLDLREVTVIGNSIGGWIAAEMAVARSPRIAGVILVDAVGIQVPGHPIADFFSLTLPQVAELSYHDPARFAVDQAALPAAAKQEMAGNRATLSVYAGDPAMADPTLRARLAGITVPALVVWGDSDRIATPDYGRAYAKAIPTAKFLLLTKTGHLPQLENPDELEKAIHDFLRR
ncbi:alpha/beta hydrolase [Kibdelosporangium aridum]|uniref:Alpha/beta hydrolase n=1 Tax=Kibdelosporangium aridum TaxID=2030 RepID=A0A428Z580_KIBAR|nr:alpha/beta hydrolase [Kibdelosporangium aridum]RSM81986.1 alpha/beta hydrolase [Kibdelosporangium aridum]